MLLFLSRRAQRGASSGDVPKAERDAAPAGGVRNPALGRPREPQSSQACADCVNLSARGTTAALRGVRWTGTGFTSLVPGNATRGQKSRWWSAERRLSVIANGED